MAEEIISVEPQGSGFLCRYKSGGCRSVNVGSGATLVHYTQDTITYKQNGQTKLYDLKTGGIRSY